VPTKFDVRNLKKWLVGRLRKCEENIKTDIGGKAREKEAVRKTKV
jgi:LEA14-like dessication related protein